MIVNKRSLGFGQKKQFKDVSLGSGKLQWAFFHSFLTLYSSGSQTGVSGSPEVGCILPGGPWEVVRFSYLHNLFFIYLFVYLFVHVFIYHNLFNGSVKYSILIGQFFLCNRPLLEEQTIAMDTILIIDSGGAIKSLLNH